MTDDLLSSPAVGTAATDLIQGCDQPAPAPDAPPLPSQPPAFALALSGGGFRATLAALGVLRFVADAGLLGQVRYVSSVSGGSLANGLFACRYRELEARMLAADALDELVLRPFMQTISTRSLSGHLLRSLWRAIGPATRTTLLANTFDDWFFRSQLLEDLPSTVRFIFNAANVTTGVRFGFERDVLGDWVLGLVTTQGTGLRVADAAAASAAVPGAFAPFVLKEVSFPCSRGRTAQLLDGGAYDNMGLEPVDDFYKEERRDGDEERQDGDVCLVGLNAGGVFQTGAYGGMPIIRDLKRANALLYRQTTALRMRTMVERFQAWERARDRREDPPEWARFGVLFGLATTIDPTAEWAEGRPDHPELREHLAKVPTSFNAFDTDLSRRLVYRGWWLAGATLSKFHRGLLPDSLPAWRDL